MVLSKRERYIAYATGAVFGLLAINYLFIDPLLARGDDLKQKIDSLTLESQHTDLLFAKSRRMSKDWSNIARGPLKRDESSAESQVLNSIGEWAQESRITFNQKTERSEKDKDFQRITYRITANGTMAQIKDFLYHIQTANIPVRIADISINNHKGEGVDDLTLNIGLATIYLPSEPDKTPRTVTPPASKESAR